MSDSLEPVQRSRELKDKMQQQIAFTETRRHWNPSFLLVANLDQEFAAWTDPEISALEQKPMSKGPH